MGRKIKPIESFCAGKVARKNDDNIYIGENFAAVIDGVSHKSSAKVDGKELRIADIIAEAIRKLDRLDAPVYAKTLTFEESVKWINIYIKEYLEKNGMTEEVGKMEATAAIYSKYHNQIWIVGDCRAVYDGKIVQNPLKVDELYIAIRKELLEALMNEGYTKEQLIEHDIARDIIKQPEILKEYINNPETVKQLKEFWSDKIKKALLECGFTEEEIEKNGLIKKYYNPRDLQKDAKNNPNMGAYGYAVLNGEYTETENCRVVDLPENVGTITLATDGFPIDSLKGDMVYAITNRRFLGRKDRLSNNINPATHASKRYGENEKYDEEYAIDDASLVRIKIEKEKREETNEKPIQTGKGGDEPDDEGR